MGAVNVAVPKVNGYLHSLSHLAWRRLKVKGICTRLKTKEGKQKQNKQPINQKDGICIKPKKCSGNHWFWLRLLFLEVWPRQARVHLQSVILHCQPPDRGTKVKCQITSP
jgi:hypothetical protein